MSYLSFPRLIFSGNFQTDPSTVNNDPEHFDTTRFQGNFQVPGAGATNGWWNPRGSAAWRFLNCTVQQVQYSDGTSTNNPAIDPVVGMPINSDVDRVEGKLVDLDPEQQMVSAIWGFQVFLGSKQNPVGFGGDLEVTSFGDIWSRFPTGQPDSFFGAFFQSVITLTKQIGNTTSAQSETPFSRFLADLQQALGAGNALSIKFNVDGYVDDPTNPMFTTGRVTGAIGVALPTEPKRFVAGRYLTAPPLPATYNTGYGLVANNALHLDLGNSLPTAAAGGALQSIGLLTVSCESTVLGTIDTSAPNWYESTAGIVAMPLTAAQVAAVSGSPISIATPSGSLLNEQAVFVRADQFVFRFNPTATSSDSQTATLYATNLGQPYGSQVVSFQFDSTAMQGQVQQGPLAGPPVGVPTTCFAFPGATPVGGTATTPPLYYTVPTDSNGVAEITISAGDPSNPRGYIDGQVYGITYGVGTPAPAIGSQGNPSQLLNLLVFNAYNIPAAPTWISDVQPIFQQYADLYPVMKPFVDLGNYGSVISKLPVLKNVFSVPDTNPNYMPVTRDLSTSKRQMLIKWIGSPTYMNIESKSELMAALQTAIELEHSTIPAYLTAMYSLQPGTNDEVRGLIRSIVMEEMLHMALACNILISIGGSPSIGHQGFVPVYPATLPGGLAPGLTVNLRKCSIEQVRDCFMRIEEPEAMVLQRRRRLNTTGPVQLEHSQYTIGWFYQQIAASLRILTEKGEITFGNTQTQVADWHGTGTLLVISSLQDALNAISEITEQGEGTTATDPFDDDGELSHYYKFSEIVEGRQLIKTANGYAYVGPVVPFNPAEVWPMVDNASLVTYPAGSRAELLSHLFARGYQALLYALNDTFNGNPGNLSNAIGAMYSLSTLAAELVQTPSGLNDGTNAGPKFKVNFQDLPGA